MRQMRGLNEAKPPLARYEHLVALQHARLAVGEIVDVDERTDEAAKRRRRGREREPLVQRAAFVGFEMAEADMADGRGIDQARHGLAQLGEHGAKPRMEQQGLVIADEEVVEAEPQSRCVDADAEHVRRDLGDLGHAALLSALGGGTPLCRAF